MGECQYKKMENRMGWRLPNLEREGRTKVTGTAAKGRKEDRAGRKRKRV